ncbi:MAG: transglycosylase domain-containing protein [Patescibacteria group bacterium]
MAGPRGIRYLALGTLILPLTLAGVFIYTLFTPVDLPARLEAIKTASVVLDKDGREVTTLYGTGRVWVPLTRIPLFLRRAVVAVEDVRFYRHRGVDLRGVARALYHDIRTGRLTQGGSTITQQLAKIVFLTQERTLWRKVSDVAYALRIERRYSKDQILEFYLNHVYLGHGAVGVEAGAQTYFGRHAWQLSRKEAALLAGVIRGPEYYSPFRDRDASEERIGTVLESMRHAGYLRAGLIRPIRSETVRLLASPGRSHPGGYLVGEIISQLRSKFGWSEEYIRRSGLRIRTTMDVKLQRAAEDTIRLLPVGYEDEDGIPQPQGAVVALDPYDGAVRAMVGGRDYLTSPLNRATRARRQPGSAIKPFVFAAAMEAGYSPETVYVDEPTEFWVGGRPWQPRNYDGIYRGPIPLRRALEESVNIVAVRLVQDIGPHPVYALARRMGLDLVGSGRRNDVGLAPLALGGLTRGVTPLELTASYAAFDNGGLRVTPYLYTSITDSRGRLVAAAGPRRQRVISPGTASLMTEMMRGVITRGTGVRAEIGRPAAGKTGTTTGYTDGWFIGYTPELVAGVWIGNDQGKKPMKTPQGNLGSGMAAALWGVFVNRALAGTVARDFTAPPVAAPAVVPGRAASVAPGKAAARPEPFSTPWWQLVRRRLRELTRW